MTTEFIITLAVVLMVFTLLGLFYRWVVGEVIKRKEEE